MSDLIFKGATRPAMVMGIPLLPMVVVGLCGVLVTMWLLQIFGWIAGGLAMLLTALALAVMRWVSKSDDQKLNQMVLRLQGWPARRNSRYWGAQSSSPIAYRRR
jgi:type IV secretion system protein VirB3